MGTETRYERILREAEEAGKARGKTRAHRVMGGDREAASRTPIPVPPQPLAVPARAALADFMEGANKLELSYGAVLQARLRAGEILGWWWQPFSLRLSHGGGSMGRGDFYRPDFLVQEADSVLAIHETKGFMQDDARTKLKLACAIYPCFRWNIVKRQNKRDGGGFAVLPFHGRLP